MDINCLSLSELLPERVNLKVIDNSFFTTTVWQPCSDLMFTAINGVTSNNDEFNLKSQLIIDYAIRENINLLITPEYSFPWKLLLKIINNEDLWVKEGNLWSICMQGISYTEFYSIIKDINKGNVIIPIPIKESILDGTYFFEIKDFVNVIIYVFQMNNVLYLLPQSKTMPMRDEYLEHEAEHLSIGNVVFIIDSITSENCLFSIICSDAFNQDISRTIHKKFKDKNRNVFVIHPQLNKNSRQPSFIQFEKNLFNDNVFREIKYLTVNWANSTNIDGKITIEQTNSMYKELYLEGSSIDNYLKYERFLKLISKNQKKGLYYRFDNELRCHEWIMYPHEQVNHFILSNDKLKNLRDPINNRVMPILKESYSLIATDEEKQNLAILNQCYISMFIKLTKLYSGSNINIIKQQFNFVKDLCGLDFENIGNLCCNNDMCCVYLLDDFVSRCFMENYVSVVTSYSKCSSSYLPENKETEERINKIMCLGSLALAISDKNKFPKSLKKKCNKIIFNFDENLRTKEYYNCILKLNSIRLPQIFGVAAYVQNKIAAQKFYNELLKSIELLNIPRILIFFLNGYSLEVLDHYSVSIIKGEINQINIVPIGITSDIDEI